MTTVRKDPAADPDDELRLIATMLRDRLEGLSAAVARAIRHDVDYYASTDALSLDDITTTVRANFELVVYGLTGDERFDTSQAEETGTSRAAVGVPLPALMHAYRIGFQMVWAEFKSIAQERTELSRSTLLDATARMWQAQDAFIMAMAAAHRERTTAKILDDASERAALTQHLLEGRVSSEQSLWEIADILRLPHRGPFLAVAAAATTVGRAPLAGIENKLRGIDLSSAWRLLPDQQIGIVYAPSLSAREQVIGLLTRVAVGRVGVSAPFAELADTSRALRYARVAMSGKGEGVNVFDDSVLGVAAVTAPEVTADLAALVLGRLYQLAPEDRDPLFDTFRMWSAVGGNVTDTAERLFVHRNTVRHRLRRIEELTGRSTTAPRDVAELCLAFEVDEHFPVARRPPVS
ncbi:PucR family transcriptional regulator [Gordonia sp. SL306]|uniref:PucR family transcriptional regulator n=1 Tax=Gordonia sp. SL306 TaxID=2995145 RepID=UPI00226EA0D5|nr:helix-turn-helix domain-containing protein [Gordonia sp. SL306]WAC54771.1 helix-turn-helix domain-containing protein [Gordonia sp. SL306]